MSEQAQEDDNVVDLDQIKEDVQAALAAEDNEIIEPVEVVEPEYTESEQRAIAMGWNPDEESLEGTDKAWIPAEEFLRNQSFFDEIKKLKREVRKQQKVTEAFKQQNEIVAEKAYNKAFKDLKAQKLQAAEDEDFAKIIAIDEQIDELRDDQQNQKAVQQASYTANDWDTAYEDFVDNNSWYKEDRVKRTFADSVGTEYVQNNPGVSPEDAYAYVIEEIDKEFKKEEPAPAQPRAAAVAASPRRQAKPAGKPKHGMGDIPEEHRSIANTLVKTGQVSEEDYLKQYFPEDYS